MIANALQSYPHRDSRVVHYFLSLFVPLHSSHFWSVRLGLIWGDGVRKHLASAVCIAIGVKLECHTKTLASAVECRCFLYCRRRNTRCAPKSIQSASARYLFPARLDCRRALLQHMQDAGCCCCSNVICLSIRCSRRARTIFRIHSEVI